MRRFITKEYIRSQLRRQWEGDVKILHTRDEMASAVGDILALQLKQQHGHRHNDGAWCPNDCVVGFDIEIKPVFRKGDFHPPALLQIATADVVYLFRLSALLHHPAEPAAVHQQEQTFTFLRPLLTDSRIIKAGVGVAGDASNLKTLVGDFVPEGFCELSELPTTCLPLNPNLRALAAHYLHCQLPKSKSVQMSNWARTDALSSDQVKYAATDAWASRAIWLAMQRQVQTNRESSTKSPPPAERKLHHVMIPLHSFCTGTSVTHVSFPSFGICLL
jgi:ribonuclease D